MTNRASQGDEVVKIVPDETDPSLASCLVMVDPYVGKLSFVKVFWQPKSDQTVFNVNEGEEERISPSVL